CLQRGKHTSCIVGGDEGRLGIVPPCTKTKRSRVKSDKLRVLNIGHSCQTSGIADERRHWLSTSRPRLISFKVSLAGNVNLQLESTRCDIWLCRGRTTRRCSSSPKNIEAVVRARRSIRACGNTGRI